MTAAEINQRIQESKRAKIKTYPCSNLRASNIGNPCERYLYLLIKHWDEQEAHDTGLQSIFDLGNHLEEHALNTLTEAGYEFVTPNNRNWKIDNPKITGREDVRLKDPATGELFPTEIKWLSPYEYPKLNTIEDFYRSKKPYIRGYPAQLLVYEYRFEKDHGYFLLGNKLTGEIKLIDVPFDWDRADALLKKAERIYAALDANDVESLDYTKDFYQCDRCNLAHMCGASVVRPETDIDVEGVLSDLIAEKERLAPSASRYEEVKDEMKAAMHGCEKVISGDYVIERREYSRNGKPYDRIFYRSLSKRR